MKDNDECFCRACGLTFTDETAFDLHRSGNWLDRGQNRHCLPLEALRGAGLVQRELKRRPDLWGEPRAK
jgi:hypothetical protein